MRKFGAYAADATLLAWVRDGAPEGRCCLEAQVMDWADDVAYSVHDVEDGILAGRIDLADARRSRASARPWSGSPARHFGPDADALERRAADALLALPVVDAVRGFDGHDGRGRRAHRAQAADQRARRPVRRRRDATRPAPGYGAGPLRRYAADLVVPPAARAEVALLKAVALRYVMSDPQPPGHAGPSARAARRAGRGAAGRRPGGAGPGARRGLERRPRTTPRACGSSSTRSRCSTDQQAVARHAALARAMR